MFHFVLSGGPIPAAHTAVLLEHAEAVGLPVRVHHDELEAEAFADGDAVVSCDMSLGERLARLPARLFHAQLAHNLTGLKGSPFDRSTAELNVLPGRQILEHYRLAPADPRFVVAGYPKWDRIYAERFRQAERRLELAAADGLEPAWPWVVFYPTGSNAAYSTTSGRAIELYLRLRRDLGPLEFVFCNHAHNQADPAARSALRELRELGRRDGHVRVVEGHGTLGLIAACDLFITDVASTLLTAVSMDKPVLFVPIETIDCCREGCRALQCGDFFDQVGHLGRWLAHHRTPAPLRELLARAVAYDDDDNCTRVTALVVERHAQWRARQIDAGIAPR